MVVVHRHKDKRLGEARFRRQRAGVSRNELGNVALAPWGMEPQFKAALIGPQNYGKVRAVLANADVLQVALGRPNREQTVTTRISAATTLEALELTNGRELTDLIRRGAQNALAENAASNKDLIPGLYARALGRKPTAEEFKLAKEVVGQAAQPAGVEDLSVGLDHAAGNFTRFIEERIMKTNDQWSRRDFLKTASAATLAALAAGYPHSLLAADEEKIKPTADTVIVLWMAGGMAHTETFVIPSAYTALRNRTGLEQSAVHVSGD